MSFANTILVFLIYHNISDKNGGRFDLAIALGVLAASEQVPAASLAELECLGELALSGELRAVQGVLPAALAARAAGRTLVVPRANAEEASLASGLKVLAVDHLLQIAAHLNGHTPLAPYQANGLLRQEAAYPDLAEVQGQLAAKRALLIAASGGHNLLLSGPPGTGKTLLASRLPGLLPPLSEEEALEVAAIHSVASHAPLTAWPRRPFRQPHHSASGPALVGGGSRPQPGEISLAHHGILFLDELPEFDRKVLEVLREPLESGHIVIARARDKVRFPARFQLVAAMNPCPCGYLGDPGGRCRCTPEQIQRYRAKLSGPLLDRIDLHLTVARESTSLLASSQAGESSAQVAARVSQARQRQLARQGCANAFLDLPGLQQHCRLPEADRLWLEQACERLNLSLRAAHRLLKVARTLADLEGTSEIGRAHLAEALQYRPSSGI
ncbi:Mg-chelatase subunits D/I family, ComM subfamily protein [Aquipseudomonas alcaligenes]|uniref:Magnesium chelatase family protein n=1 Tax=Aquipseudomonas alcaligenes (strain ATCC 14909 / DSM 50342 / CCUG 1425 / JCM 20561 / NBRC 14159 / NCIMB 9945 / NCTC 10367 / 1577) TaxID=1215092 RepID=U2ZSA3_AQUA1|nr:YifB family Mg chelatase-like AAA ATPase [Pseudomonas alcaligenes]GAD63962.1 magnesium chelatase family protein [Pseudomonas alcaligenes NBRC 14159]SUD13151.1 Mg-chelatase subunits D/I family, ComM subfamily protein [Pseudomonas alcaligenes]